MHIQNPNDLATGVLYMLLGLLAFFFVGEGELGTLARMGPQYFPKIVAAGLIAVGAAVALKGLSLKARRTDAPREPFALALRSLDPKVPAVILGSALLFGTTLLTLGFLASVFLTVFASTAAHRSFVWKRSLLLALGLTALTTLIFVLGMGLPVTLLPPALGLI